MNNNELANILIENAVYKAIGYYGLEGTEEAIKRVYKLMPTLKYRMLSTYYGIITQKKEAK